MTWLLDPKIFNYIIMGLYVLNAGRWAIHGSWGDTMYWASACAITVSVTWGMTR